MEACDSPRSRSSVVIRTSENEDDPCPRPFRLGVAAVITCCRFASSSTHATLHGNFLFSFRRFDL